MLKRVSKMLVAIALLVGTQAAFGAPQSGVQASIDVGSSTDSAETIKVQNAVLKATESTLVPAQVQGTIATVNIKEGSHVKMGQVLARLNEDSIRHDLEQQATQVKVAEFKSQNDINLRLAKKSLEVAQTEYERALRANERVSGTYPINEMDRLKLVADHAQLEIERAEYDRSIADYELQLAKIKYKQMLSEYHKHQLKAPANGMVVAVDKRVGEWVEPGSEILRLMNMDVIRVEGFIGIEVAGSELLGNEIELVTRMGTEKRYAGKVTFISPDVNPVNSQVRIVAEVENEHGMLRPGIPVDAVIRKGLQSEPFTP